MLSAVILGYNRCKDVLITIDKLKDFERIIPFEMEIIVVDNGSVDNTSDQVKMHHPDVTLVTKINNNGIAGWNAGFEVAKHKYLLVLDDDSSPVAGITEAVEYLEQNPKTGILALNITSGPYLTDEWRWQDGKPWGDKQEVIGFFGCGAIIRKEVFDKIGGFAEWLLVYAHEWEYGIRCIDAGYDIRYFKNSSIDHRASPVNRSQKRARVYTTRNDLGIVYKFFRHNKWKWIFTVLINNLKELKTGNFKNAWYDLVGFAEFLKLIKSLDYTPVSESTQHFFTRNYMKTHPVFGFVSKKLKSSEQLTNDRRSN